MPENQTKLVEEQKCSTLVYGGLSASHYTATPVGWRLLAVMAVSIGSPRQEKRRVIPAH